MPRPTRAQLLRERAALAHLDSPEEAAITQRMLAESPEGTLDSIATAIKAEWGKSLDSQFAIGRLLIEAHRLMPDDREYGRWFASQNFPFRKGTAFLLQRGAEREDEVRLFIGLRGQENDRDIGVPYAIQLLTAQAKAKPVAPPSEDRVNPWLGWFEESREAIATLDQRMDEGWPLRDDFDDLDDWTDIAVAIERMVATLNRLKAIALGNGPPR